MVRYVNIPRGAAPLVGDLHIRYKGVWDMQDLCECIVSWLRERKYKVSEPEYEHRPPSSFGNERRYSITAWQNIDEWMSASIDVYMHTFDAHDIEVIDKNGKKRVFTKGKIWLYLRINKHWDSEGRWDSGSFFGQLKGFYVNYIVRKKIIEGWERRYRHELTSLYHFIQKKLKMESRNFGLQDIARVHDRGP